MSDIPRYRPVANDKYGITDDVDGKLCEYRDYARLKAEVERLDHQVRYWRIEAEVDNARWLRCLQDLEELRASSFVTAVPVEQYERVVKAGDAMADEIIGCYKAEGYDPADSETLPKWNAAKEGKPSV